VKYPRHRLYATLLFLGAGLLLYRTIAMIMAGALTHLTPWVVFLLLVEMVIDGIAMLVCLAWGLTGKARHINNVVRVTTAVVVMHAVRVLIFVLGRIGPWTDFDVRPEARALHATRWTWNDVYLAGGLSALSVILLIVFLRSWRRNKSNWIG